MGERFQLEFMGRGFEKPAQILFLPASPKVETEIFPWEHIRSGVTKAYLREEWEKASQGGNA
jgi:hypothetical protein